VSSLAARAASLAATSCAGTRLIDLCAREVQLGSIAPRVYREDPIPFLDDLPGHKVYRVKMPGYAGAQFDRFCRVDAPREFFGLGDELNLTGSTVTLVAGGDGGVALEASAATVRGARFTDAAKRARTMSPRGKRL